VRTGRGSTRSPWSHTGHMVLVCVPPRISSSSGCTDERAGLGLAVVHELSRLLDCGLDRCDVVQHSSLVLSCPPGCVPRPQQSDKRLSVAGAHSRPVAGAPERWSGCSVPVPFLCHMNRVCGRAGCTAAYGEYGSLRVPSFSHQLLGACGQGPPTQADSSVRHG
jgi:hypothetical protein